MSTEPLATSKYEKPVFPYLAPFVLGILFFCLYGLGNWPGMPGFAEGQQSTLGFLGYRWATDPSATHGWLIIPIATTVVWYKREKLRRTPLSSDKRGLWVVLLALLMHLSEKALDLNGPSPLSIPIFLAGAVWYLAGTAWLRELAFPLAYLTFFLPIPGGLTQPVSFPLRLIATSGSKWIVEHLFNVHMTGAGMDMEFPFLKTGEAVRVKIADPCSGIHSLMAIKALHAITAYISRLDLKWKWVLFWLALPITLAANVIRITLLILVCTYYDPKFGLGTFHDASPYPLFIIVLLLLVSIGRFLERVTGGEKRWKARQEAEKADWAANPAPAKWNRTGGAPKLMPLGAMMAATLMISLVASARSTFKAPSVDVKMIPAELGRWKCPEGDISDAALAESDSYLIRQYVRDDGQQVQLLVVYRRYGRREFAHRPDQCFPAGGYVQLLKDTTTLPWAGREDTAVHMLFDGSKVEYREGKFGVPVATVSYFFASGNRTESDFMRQQLIMATERLFPNKNGWTFVRLVTHRTTTDEAALAAQKDFMKTFEPEIRKIITTDPETAGKEGA
ncbi:MAG: EpsI family protein [Armatimonadetes bacterium]|nr:EpsI family protein [Armatimonadota bacterium]